jgi:light-regulated signal transduction histidine kinase (bacteriophytochrome)
MRSRSFSSESRITLILAGFFLTMAGSYCAGIRQTQSNPGAPQKTYRLALAPFGRRFDIHLRVGQVGLIVIVLLMLLSSAAIALALLAEQRRRKIEAASRELLDEITRRKRAQEEVAQLNAELEAKIEARTRDLQAANKELDAFCSSVAHDLRAPLCALEGFSHVLLREYQEKLGEQGEQYLQRIRTATKRMAQLIDDLLSLSRVSRTDLRRENFDLTAAAREVVTELRRLDPNRNVEMSVAEGLAAQGDPRFLRQVLENLLGNAWKYTSNQPAARIEMGVCEGKDGRPAFFVKDNGAGFDMRFANKLFGVFQRLHSGSEFPGTGVGLATVQRIIHRHGGQVWAEGSVGQGATFYFTL